MWQAEQGQKFENLKSPQSMSISGGCSTGRERKFKKNQLLQSFHFESFYSVGLRNSTRVPGFPKTRVNPPIFKPVNPDLSAGKNPGLTGLNFGCQYCREQRGMDYSKFHDISDRFGYFFALGFVTGNIYSRLSAIRQPCDPEYGRKERFGGSRGQTGSRNMAATRFLTQRPRLSICPKVGQSRQLLPVLQIHFRFDHDDFLHAFFELRSISPHFGPFRALL